jgi:exodeoxyribonuclease VII large subunit
VKQRAAQLNALAAHLEAVGPENVLRRGYSITTVKKGGAVVRAAGQLKPGERILTRFAEGTAESIVEDSAQLPLFE